MTVEDISKRMTQKKGAGFVVVNKALMKNLGLVAAAIYTELVRDYLYYEKKGELTADGEFFCTEKTIEKEMGLKDDAQKRALRKLEDLGLIEVKLKGIPRKRYITICTREEFVNAAFTFDDGEPKKEDNEETEEQAVFDLAKMDDVIRNAAKECGKDAVYAEDMRKYYRGFFAICGRPENLFSRSSVRKFIKRIDEINGEWMVFDIKVSTRLHDEYMKTQVRSGTVRTPNHLFSEGFYDNYLKRLGYT